MACSKVLTSNMEEEEEGRSCAFCLHPLAPSEVRKCSSCHRRAYCGQDCQLADWKGNKRIRSSSKATGRGQGHKDWCKLSVGEELLDWAIREVKGKGRGLVALRDLPAVYRILVEGWQTLDQVGLPIHPGFQTLSGPGLSQQDKFKHFSYPDESGNLKLLFRYALVNHACDANAGLANDDEFNVWILYSLRPIPKGEEICVQYALFYDVEKPLPILEDRAAYLKKQGIRCPPNCICKDANLRSQLEKISKLHHEIAEREKFVPFDPPVAEKVREQAIPRINLTLKIGEEAGLRVDQMMKLHQIAWHAHSGTATKGEFHYEKVKSFWEQIYHPNSSQQLDKWMKLESERRKKEGPKPFIVD